MNVQQPAGMYICLISVHGLIRSENLELGRDADTGGQTLYVVELAKELSKQKGVARVDLITRRIDDPKVDPIYNEAEEKLTDRSSIIRVECGPRRYLRKEVLWPYLDHFANEVLKHYRAINRVPDVVHAHYADAGYVGRKLSQILAVPMVFTGHSLGRVKQKRLEEKGISSDKIEKTYSISERIDAEEKALTNATMVVASTNQEVEEQYELYERYQPQKKVVIPPGTDLSRFSVSRTPIRSYPYYNQLSRFLREPQKPIVLAIARADERKNLTTLVEAFAMHPHLRNDANLVILAGNRDDLNELEPGARDVIRRLLYLVDKHDLYGSVALPKTHASDDVPAMYRMCARSQGVFVNPALTEPFGLTLIEAAACGAPIVATNDGGPRDIIGHCKNGLLIDPFNPKEIGEAIFSLIDDPYRWKECSQGGVRCVKKHYSWTSHARTYINTIREFIKKDKGKPFWISTGKRLMKADRMFITDIDNTLLGDSKATRELAQKISDHSKSVGFGIATGRHLESALEVLEEWNVPRPDMLVTSVGSEIHYGDDLKEDLDWERHIDYKWEPERLIDFCKTIPGIELQPEENQGKHKVSYFLEPGKAPGKRELVRMMRENRFHVKSIYSHQQFLDFLPLRASKGLAIWYLSNKWGIPMERILTAGDSGNDEEMLRGHCMSVVVGNYSAELEILRKNPTVFFARQSYAAGILEGMTHFDFFGDINFTASEDT